jgi:hypothetical protein
MGALVCVFLGELGGEKLACCCDAGVALAEGEPAA